MKKFTIIDYIIILLVILAVVFAFIHITSDDSSKIQKTAFDASTMNKLPETYLNHYKNGNVVKSTVTGINSTNGAEITLNGTVKWINEYSPITVLIESDNETYTAALYKDNPNADIYIDKISLENNGSTYDNLKEFTIKPQNITSLKDLKHNLTNANYEISTSISVDSVDAAKMQEIKNTLFSHNKRESIQANVKFDNQIVLLKANGQNIDDGDSILGSINGLTDEIKLRVYDCSDADADNIKNNYEVTNIRTF